MRLSEWRVRAPQRDALGPRVLAVLEPVLATLGADRDPHVWIGWGGDAAFRYTLLAPTPAGLAVCLVRPTGGPDGPRVTGKLVRWGRVQVGDLDVETQEAHRLATVQIEGQVLKGVDDEADRVARFARTVMAAHEGRPTTSLDEPAARGTRGRTSATTSRTVSPGRAARSGAGSAARVGTSKTAGSSPALSDPAAPKAGSARASARSAHRP
jgi:hypothetical protein